MSDPEHALDYIRRQNEPALFVFCDLHPFMQSPRVVRLLKMIAMNPEEQAPTLLLVSHELPLAPELRRLAARISLSMPSDEQLAAIIREEAARWTARNQGRRVRTDNRTLEQVVRNLRGVTHEEARLLARKLIVDDGAITQEDLPVLNQAKFSLLDMQGVLSFEQDTARFAEVGGLARFKRWLQERQAAFNDGGRADAPRGVLLAGVQGSGKSLAARAVAGLWGLPLLRLDFAALYNKYIGETEKNLREALAMADAMQPCVLWIDEIEKGLADDGSDQGVSRRVLGTLLTWMAERRSRVFLVATANNVAQLPAELIRKGRHCWPWLPGTPGCGARPSRSAAYPVPGARHPDRCRHRPAPSRSRRSTARRAAWHRPWPAPRAGSSRSRRCTCCTARQNPAAAAAGPRGRPRPAPPNSCRSPARRPAARPWAHPRDRHR